MYSCSNKDGTAYDLTPICGKLPSSSNCWSSCNGRVWCHIEKKMREWDGENWEGIYIFWSCCGKGNKWEQKIASQVAPRVIVAHTNVSIVTTSKPTIGNTSFPLPAGPSCTTACVKGSNLCGISVTHQGTLSM